MEKSVQTKNIFEHKVVWLDGNRVGIIYDYRNLMAIKEHACLYGDILDVNYLLHRDNNAEWYIWTRFDDDYMHIYTDRLDPDTKVEDYVFQEAIEIIEIVKKEEELELLSEHAQATVQMFEEMIDRVIELDPSRKNTSVHDVMREKLDDYKRSYI